MAGLPYNDKTDCDHKAYLKFIETWGLHVVTGLQMGGSMGHTAIFDQVNEAMSSSENSTAQMKVYGQYGTIKGDASASVEKNTDKQFLSELESCDSQVFVYGGEQGLIKDNVVTDKQLGDWITSVSSAPVPLHVYLTPIVDLLDWKYFAPLASVVEISGDHLQRVYRILQRWQESTYCEYLRATKTIDIYSCTTSFNEGTGLSKPQIAIAPTVELYSVGNIAGSQFRVQETIEPMNIISKTDELYYRNTTMPAAAEFRVSGTVVCAGGVSMGATVRICVNGTEKNAPDCKILQPEATGNQTTLFFETAWTELPYASVDFIKLETNQKATSYSLLVPSRSIPSAGSDPLAAVSWTVTTRRSARPVDNNLKIDGRILFDSDGQLIRPPYNVKFSGFVSFNPPNGDRGRERKEALALAGNCEMVVYVSDTELSDEQHAGNLYTGSFGQLSRHVRRDSGSRSLPATRDGTSKKAGMYVFVALVAVPKLEDTIDASLYSSSDRTVFNQNAYAQVLRGFNYNEKERLGYIAPIDTNQLSQTICAPFCPFISLGDDTCIPACNNTACFFDGGACIPPPLPPAVKPPSGMCSDTGSRCTNASDCESGVCGPDGHCCPTACKDCKNAGICVTCESRFYLTSQALCMARQSRDGVCTSDHHCQESLMCASGGTCAVAPLIVIGDAAMNLGASAAGTNVSMRVSKLGHRGALSGSADSSGKVTWTSSSITIPAVARPLKFSVSLWRDGHTRPLQEIVFQLPENGQKTFYTASWRSSGDGTPVLQPPNLSRPLFVQFSAWLTGDGGELDTTATPPPTSTAPGFSTSTTTDVTTVAPTTATTGAVTTVPLTPATPEFVCRLILDADVAPSSCFDPNTCDGMCRQVLVGSLEGTSLSLASTTPSCFCPLGQGTMTSKTSTSSIQVTWSNGTSFGDTITPLVVRLDGIVTLRFGKCELPYRVAAGEILGVVAATPSKGGSSSTWVIPTATVCGVLLCVALAAGTVVYRRRARKSAGPEYSPVPSHDDA